MQECSILIVDDDPGAIQALGRCLAGAGHLRFATSGVDALLRAAESAPDLLLLDADMPGMSGLETCAAFKADPALAGIPIIFVTARHDADFEVTAFENGAVDFIVKPVRAPLVLARVKVQLRNKHLSDELRRLSLTDGLTGVANRRRFEETLQREWLRARRAGEPLALLMIDVDHFKRFNDSYGHPAGDACLQAVAQGLQWACLRPGDLVARYGGEEFALLLPQTARSGADQVARRVLEEVAALGIAHTASATSSQITVSIGLACHDEDCPAWAPPVSESRLGNDMLALAGPEALVLAADLALYQAKRLGRDRVEFHAMVDPSGHAAQLRKTDP